MGEEFRIAHMFVRENLNYRSYFIEYEEDYDYDNSLMLMMLKLWREIFLTRPAIFTSVSFDDERLIEIRNNRYELFKLKFNIEYFVDFFIKRLQDTLYCLKNFTNLDKIQTHLYLIVDDYVSELLTSVLDVDYLDLKSQIRSYKLKIIKNEQGLL